MIEHDDGFDAFSFQNNAYVSSAPTDEWFCIDGTRSTLDEWKAASGESSATVASGSYPDPGRNLDTYAAELGLGSTLADFAEATHKQRRHDWDPDLTANAANDYIRAGYGGM